MSLKSLAWRGAWVVLSAWTAAAQTSNAGSVAVNVLDPAGAVVPRATLQLKDLGTNDVRQAETQSNGTYSFPDLPFGVYELTVSKSGFESQLFPAAPVCRLVMYALFEKSLFDIRHVVHASGTYDLPFGKGRSYLNTSRLAEYTVGGWTVGTIISLQSGNPALLGGGYNTVNGNDSGINLNGITTSDLQSMVGVYRSGNPWVTLFDRKLIGANGAANPAYLMPATTAGVFGYRPYVWGPGWYNIDLSVNKSIPIRESIRFTFQAEFLSGRAAKTPASKSNTAARRCC